MKYCVDAQRFAVIGKTDSPIAYAKAKFTGVSREFSNVTLSSLSETMQRGKNPHGGFPVEVANVGACAIGPRYRSHLRALERLAGLRLNSVTTS